jgi:hypothetical protein
MIKGLPPAAGALLLVVSAGCAHDTRPGPTTSAAPAPVAASVPAQQGSDDPVVARARRALVESGIDARALKVESVTAKQWNDSSLGCRRPGEVYLQVITNGHVVRFASESKVYEVRVAGEHAVICGLGPDVVGPRGNAATNARNLEIMLEQARTDLAARLGADRDEVELRNLEPAVWLDAGLGCEVPVAGPAQKIAGYKLFLTFAGRVFTYHTDMQRVIPCPPIESE